MAGCSAGRARTRCRPTPPASTSWRGSAAATWPPSAARWSRRRRRWNTYIQVDSADDTVAKVQEAGGTVVSEPYDVFDSGRLAVFADPQGATFSVWQPEPAPRLAGRQRARHGQLQRPPTTDVEGAKAFYGAVFGWGLLDMGGEGGAWTLPGLRRPPGGAQPGHPRALRRDGRARRLHRRRREPAAGGRRRRPRWGVMFGRRRRRRDRREARRSSAARCVVRAVRRAVGADERASPTRRARRSPRASSCPRTSALTGATPPHQRALRRRRSAARPPRRAAGRGRCRGGRSSRSW